MPEQSTCQGGNIDLSANPMPQPSRKSPQALRYEKRGVCVNQQAFRVTGLQFVMMGDEEETVEDSKGDTWLGV